jgi:ubiquinone/menaquinone biosynthesis C-methylase UbiE
MICSQSDETFQDHTVPQTTKVRTAAFRETQQLLAERHTANTAAMASLSKNFQTAVLDQYTPRASGYDAAAGGWHAELAQDFTTWLPAPRGGTVLDLACGTGLVTIPYAEAIGSDGIVIGIDLTKAMLDVAQAKPVAANAAPIEWVEGDITLVRHLGIIRHVLAERGGFDVISCCSAFVLLEKPADALRDWVALLKPGSGRIIIDVPTEDLSLQFLFNYPLRKAMGQELVFDQQWVKGKDSLDRMFEEARLVVEQSFRTRSYLPAHTYNADDGATVFERITQPGEMFGNTCEKWKQEGGQALVERARQAWSEIWKESLNADGQVRDGHALYISIGRRE